MSQPPQGIEKSVQIEHLHKALRDVQGDLQALVTRVEKLGHNGQVTLQILEPRSGNPYPRGLCDDPPDIGELCEKLEDLLWFLRVLCKNAP